MEHLLKFIVGHDPSPLTGAERGSFAYITIKDRLPVILTKVIDLLCREKDLIYEEYGENVSEEIKDIVGQLSQMKNELQTNKPLRQFPERSCSLDDKKYDDSLSWNSALQLYKEKNHVDPKWFEVSWLFVECYFYKKIHDSFMSSKLLKNFDPYNNQKTSSLQNASEPLKLLSERMKKEVLEPSTLSLEEKKAVVLEFIEISLWGNQWDLSISCGTEVERENSLSRLEEMRENIIACDLENVWHHLIALPKDKKKQIAFILDNSGLELFADFCLAALLIKFKLVDSISFYTKTRPWFISDTTTEDFNWTVDYLKKKDGDINEVSQVFDGYLRSGVWDIKESSFWTTHFDFSEMKKVDEKLYEELGTYSLIVFKGDLNYRKLTGDLNWSNDTSFRRALRGFLPSSLLVLRTIKGGPTVGLDESSQKVQKAKQNENWNISGEIGLIQFIPHRNSFSVKQFSLLVSSSVFIILVAIYLKSYV